MEDKNQIIRQLVNEPLYKKLFAEKYYFSKPLDFHQMPFTANCPKDGEQTFHLTLEPIAYLQELAKLDGNPEIPFLQELNKFAYNLEHIHHYSATCGYCKQYRINFLFQIELEDNWVNQSKNEGQKERVIIRKVGQYPAYKLSADKIVLNYLNKEDKDNYEKAIACIKLNLNVGAFAYLRRIIENEMRRIVEDISKISRPESKEILKLLESFKDKKQMDNLIEEAYKYLPSSLKSIGDNPLKLLWGQLSGGIHEFTEEECGKKADSINQILTFIIKKINEENSEILEVRNAMKNLRTN